MKKLLFAMALGAALAWAFDPDAGSRRRDLIRRKLDEMGITRSATPHPVVSPATPAFDDLAAPLASVR